MRNWISLPFVFQDTKVNASYQLPSFSDYSRYYHSTMNGFSDLKLQIISHPPPSLLLFLFPHLSLYHFSPFTHHLVYNTYSHMQINARTYIVAFIECKYLNDTIIFSLLKFPFQKNKNNSFNFYTILFKRFYIFVSLHLHFSLSIKLFIIFSFIYLFILLFSIFNFLKAKN